MLLCLILRLQVGRSFAITDGLPFGLRTVCRWVCGRFVVGFADVCRRCVAPVADGLPLQGAIPFKPWTLGGTQGVAVLRPALPWAEIPLPLQGAMGSKPPSLCIALRSQASPQHSSCKQACLALHSVCTDIALTGRHGFKTSDVRHVRKGATVWNLGLCVDSEKQDRYDERYRRLNLG